MLWCCRAVVISSIAGWLIMRIIGIDLPGVSDYTKNAAVILSTAMGIIVFDAVRLTTFRLRWFDIPMVVFCLYLFFSAISNDLGPYDGLSASACQKRPHNAWIGRCHTRSAECTLPMVESYRELGLGMIIGSVCLIPFCRIEFKD